MSEVATQTNPSSLRFLTRDQLSSFATAPGIVICFGMTAPTGANIDQFFEAAERGIARLPSGAGLILVVHDSSTPDADARDAMKRKFPLLSQKLVGTAFVLRARGFVSATQRAMITAVMLATGNRNKVLATSDVKEAVDWIYSRLPASVMAKTSPSVVLAEEIVEFCDEELARGVPSP